MEWRVFSASVIGKSHIDGLIPCQDANFHAVIGDILLAVVCDGAGSAKSSEVGATYCAKTIVDSLKLQLSDLGRESFIATIDGNITQLIGSARKGLFDLASSLEKEARDFNCTLVGVVAHPLGGFFFHIGDGLGLANNSVDNVTVVSNPENGEYSNETYFVVSDDWEKHVRTTHFTGSNWTYIALMSDGAMSFVMDKGHKGFSQPFMNPVKKFLEHQTDNQVANEALHAVLADERTYSITSDDKTLLLALLT